MVKALKVVVLGELAFSGRLCVDVTLAEFLPEGEAARRACISTYVINNTYHRGYQIRTNVNTLRENTYRHVEAVAEAGETSAHRLVTCPWSVQRADT